MSAGDGTLKYIYLDGSNWITETVDSDVSFWRESNSLALDGNDNPHIGYSSDISGSANLNYAYYDGSNWITETVDSIGLDGSDTSLALDGGGRPHIAYEDSDDDDLKYAYHDGVDWHIETVDAEGYAGSHCSLALDSTGHPHISYYYYQPSSYGKLKYAYHNGSSWQIEVVDDTSTFVGSYTSLALDSAGHPHISYYDRTNEDLKYASYDGVAWHIRTVDGDDSPGTGVGLYNSLALDIKDLPHISYYDHTGQSIRYARGGYWVYLPQTFKNMAPPLPPTLDSISNPGGVGRYTVAWSTVNLASNYILEESSGPNFFAPTTVYAGPETSISTTNGLGTYYYRVKAQNSSGSSDWSNIEVVTVTVVLPVDGDWGGSTSEDDLVQFTISGGGAYWDYIQILHKNLCGTGYTNYYTYDGGSIVDGRISHYGSFIFDGDFVSPTHARGDYIIYDTSCGFSQEINGTWTARP